MLISELVHGVVLLAILSPLDVGGVLGCSILVDERLDHGVGIIEFSEAVLEQARFFEVLHVGLSRFQLVELRSELREDVSDARVIREHHAADLVRSGDVGTLLREGDLNGGRTPWDEVGKFALSDPLQGLVHLRGVDVALDDVENRNVRAFLHARRAQNVLGLEESPHHIKHRSLSN